MITVPDHQQQHCMANMNMFYFQKKKKNIMTILILKKTIKNEIYFHQNEEETKQLTI